MEINYRTDLKATDRNPIRDILESTTVFYDFEVRVALGILDEHLREGATSDYSFIIAEQGNQVLGYVNFGPTPCTQGSWDIYWIAVKKDTMNRGMGKVLLKMSEEAIQKLGGVNIWVETSSRESYMPTRAFYDRQGYKVVAELKDFYGPGDHKVIYHKKV